MNLNIFGQHNNLAKEQEKLKKAIEKINHRFVIFEKYVNYAKRVEKSRKEKKIISQEKLFREFGF